MREIHSTAVVSPDAQLGENVVVEPFAVIEDNVEVGDGSHIGSSVLLASGARLGKNVRVFHGAAIGSVPQDLKFAGEETLAIVGDNTVVREYATINRGTAHSGQTRVGSDCLLMAYSHVAHDCSLGDNVIMGNSATLAGHIEVHDYAILSGLLPVHQFVKIGKHAMIGGGYRVPMDICPYALAAGYPLRIAGLNIVGLRRRGFSRQAINNLQQAFKLLFFGGLNTSQAVDRIKDELEQTEEIKTILDFIAASHRGLCK
ncbi:MAG: acyl-ACP--UDP-N-acetylglucosamine O-acyltransferase [bacterium]